METVTPLGKTKLNKHTAPSMFLVVSLPANTVKFPDPQKNGNSSLFTQSSLVLGSAEKTDQISEEDQRLADRPLVWISLFHHTLVPAACSVKVTPSSLITLPIFTGDSPFD